MERSITGKGNYDAADWCDKTARAEGYKTLFRDKDATIPHNAPSSYHIADIATTVASNNKANDGCDLHKSHAA